MGFPDGASGKEPSCQCTRRSLGCEDPPEKGMQPMPVFIPEESHSQRSLADYSPWGCKVRHDERIKNLRDLSIAPYLQVVDLHKHVCPNRGVKDESNTFLGSQMVRRATACIC